MAKTGRPVKEIDFKLFENLCAIQCTLAEIAACLNCSEDTVERRVEEHYGESFAEVFAEKKRLGKMSLRRSMFRKAQEGNPTMLIWLSKQHLGMREKIEQSGNEKKPVRLAYKVNDK